jgi:microsomal dipeptidase-like Zn-dependent dipeptidase
MSALAFGGRYIWGQHDGPPATALRRCSGHSFDGHGFGGGAEGGAGNLKPHGKGGHPSFDGWPRWNSTSHQQVHSAWLKKAHADGLRLIVMPTVHNADFCKILPQRMRDPQARCDDDWNIRRQVEAARAFERRHPWYRIAESPAEARRIIGEGKLAVILAIETSNAFDEGDVHKRLDDYYRLGIRAIQPVHEINNRMGGAAWHALALRALQTLHNLKDWKSKAQILLGDLGKVLRGESRDGFFTGVGKALRGFVNRIAGIEMDAHRRNVKGLSAEGEKLIREMIRRRMLIDVSHLSHRGIRRVVEIAREHRYYPLFNSHAHFKEIASPNDAPQEWYYPVEVYQWLAETGGVIGLRTDPDEQRTYRESGVPNDCPGSTKSFAQVYQWVVKELKLPVTLASDFNGWALNLRPRFGPDGCGSRGAREAEAFRKKQTGRLGTALDTQGFGHIGLEGDVLRELKNFGVDVAPLEASAETFIRMWERAEDPRRTRVEHRVDLRAAVAKILPYDGPPRGGLLHLLPEATGKVREVAGKVAAKVARAAKVTFDAAKYAGCLIRACARSPRQCLRGSGSDFERDVRGCDQSAGVSRGASFFKCALGWIRKGFTPFSGVKSRDVPEKIRSHCRP